jgi:hypothetical protein
MFSSEFPEVLFSSPTWWLVALCFTALAGMLKLLTSVSLVERQQRHKVQSVGHPKTGPERTLEEYERAFRQARHHHH